MDIQNVSVEVAIASVSTGRLGIPNMVKWVKKAIAEDPRLIEKLGNQTVQEIRVLDAGSFLVVTDSCEMLVDVKYFPPTNPHIIGEPPRFELTFHDPVWL